MDDRVFIIPALPNLIGTYIADYETTVSRDTSKQNKTEVWATALTYMFSEDPNEVMIDNTLSGFMNRCFTLNKDYLSEINTSKVKDKKLKDELDKLGVADIYFHNVKFDGSFILNWLLNNGFIDDINNEYWYMEEKHFTYLISDKGQWYYIGVRCNDRVIIFKDSLKILPMSVEKMAKDFGIENRKGKINYALERYSGWNITDEEKEYIELDVLIVKECLFNFFKLGGTGLTIGSCCMNDFKKTMSRFKFNKYFPSLNYKDDNMQEETYDSFIRESYKGGWCYCCPNKANTTYSYNDLIDVNEYKNIAYKINDELNDIINECYSVFDKIAIGCTLDVNSLYPSMMHSDSGNKFPYGLPIRVEDYTGVSWDNTLEEIAKDWNNNRILFNEYYFVRIKCRFRIKDGYLPFIQVKHNNLYPSNKMLTSSNPVDKNGNEIEMNIYPDENNNPVEEPFYITLTLTCIDLLLFTEHYNILEFEIQKKVVFKAMCGLFDEYINKWRDLKIQASINKNESLRTICKLFLNNLYGKTGTNPNKAKVKVRIENNILKFDELVDTSDNSDWSYVAVASAVTSYGRNFTIRASQKFYFGEDRQGFIYADTDSMHINLPKEQIIKIAEENNIKLHDDNFNCWKIESEWCEAKFIRQKTYVERIRKKDKDTGKYYLKYDVKCAGMGKRCCELFNMSLNKQEYDIEDMTYDEILFMKGLYRIKNKPDIPIEELLEIPDCNRTIDDFQLGLQIPSNIKAKQIDGGTLLTEYAYELRP